MAQRIETFTFTVAANTSSSSPTTQALTMRRGRVRRFEVMIPPGHRALTGLAVLHSGQQVIPFQVGSWIVGDDETIPWPLERYPTAGKWSVRGYNTDVHAHSFYLRFLLEELDLVRAPIELLAAPLEL